MGSLGGGWFAGVLAHDSYNIMIKCIMIRLGCVQRPVILTHKVMKISLK